MLTSTESGRSVLNVAVPTVRTDPGRRDPAASGQFGSAFAAILRSEAPAARGRTGRAAAGTESAAAYLSHDDRSVGGRSLRP